MDYITSLPGYEEFEPYAELFIKEITPYIPIILGFMAVFVIFYIIVQWRIFNKMDEPGWKCLVPIYNTFTWFKCVWGSGWYMLLLLIPIVNLIIALIHVIKIANAFDKGAFFIIGLIFLPTLFDIILAFDRSVYVGPASGGGSRSGW